MTDPSAIVPAKAQGHPGKAFLHGRRVGVVARAIQSRHARPRTLIRGVSRASTSSPARSKDVAAGTRRTRPAMTTKTSLCGRLLHLKHLPPNSPARQRGPGVNDDHVAPGFPFSRAFTGGTRVAATHLSTRTGVSLYATDLKHSHSRPADGAAALHGDGVEGRPLGRENHNWTMRQR
jgi:hypothetical protein